MNDLFETVPFFDDKPIGRMYKIYNDGGHYIALPVVNGGKKRKSRGGGNSSASIAFDSLYSYALEQDMSKEDMRAFIKDEMQHIFPNMLNLDKYIDDKLGCKRKNLWNRTKRFRRKAYLNKWNFFVTITFDDRKHDEESFRRKLRKCLSNLHTRRGWKYMGVFEHAPETHRLHFHALMYIPDGEMIGTIKELSDYSTAQGKMQTTHSNSFFADSFGRNDFEMLNDDELRHGGTINYLLKYISKTGEKIVYSRGNPTEICRKVEESDIVTEMEDFGRKYILFDDVITWERDVMHYGYKQVSITDLICNPPKVA